ncbi:hypothetical protein ACFFJ4_17765 [Xanthomonas dyei]|uniref:DUF3077 domain-containing protein n=1 Tax=Xanthomonas dyei TaxID=743699 RepID=A0A2S7BY67_9XANT|nr:hypothetical protein [Xanthomonas dyei]MCC4635641.1 hypothetical protein [Xanthomonas dyei pv. eucalypti]PPU54215.1 hypothetical protein XdyCFBP7245_19135 [Xanthomonas dyei]
MTTTKTRKTTAPEGRTQTREEHFTFGVTIEQMDRFHMLLRTITAQSDMVAVCSGKPLDATSLSILGENIFNAARAVRAIVDEIDAQRLYDGGADPTD